MNLTVQITAADVRLGVVADRITADILLGFKPRAGDVKALLRAKGPLADSTRAMMLDLMGALTVAVGDVQVTL